MAARAVAGVETARTAPVIVNKAQVIHIVFASEIGLQGGDGNSLRLTFVPLRFLDLTYQAGMHLSVLHLYLPV
jgi:hypothetical protein